MTLTTEELAGTTVASAEERGGAEVGQGGANGARRMMRCGDWIRLGDAAAEVVEEVHAASLREDAGA